MDKHHVKHFVTLAFFRAFDKRNGEATILSRSIAAYTGGFYSHAELIIEIDGTSEQWGADPEYGKVMRSEVKYDTNKWDYIKLPVDDIRRIRRFLLEVEGLKYDYFGIIGFILPTKDRSDRWFCSELIANCIKIDGNKLMWFTEPSSIDPNTLAIMVGLIDKKFSYIELYKILNNKGKYNGSDNHYRKYYDRKHYC